MSFSVKDGPLVWLTCKHNMNILVFHFLLKDEAFCFSNRDFVLEYRGKRIPSDSPSAFESYSETEVTYLFDFQWKEKSWW